MRLFFDSNFSSSSSRTARHAIAQKDGKIIELLSLLHYVDEGHASFEGVR
jgi:hypothetical protein